MKIKNILVAMDFSPVSNVAVSHAVALARRLRAKLTLIHVMQPMPPRASRVVTDKPKGREDVLRDFWTLLGSENKDGVDLEFVLKSGDVRQEIAEAIREQHADLAVLGTHGHSRLGHTIIGSTTEDLLRKLPIPILTVSHEIKPTAMKRILFATSLAEASSPGFAFALDLARKLHAEVVAFHAMTERSQERHLTRKEAQRKLDALVDEGKRQNVKVRTLLTEGSAAQAILQAAGEEGAQLIVVALEAVIKEALMGTTAEQVVRDAKIPVLSIPMHEVASHEKLGEAA